MNMNITSRNRLLAGLFIASLVATVALTGAVGAQSTANTTTNTTMVNTSMATNGTATTNETMMTNATGNASLMAESTAAGAVTNHTLNATVTEAVAGNLSGVSINYTAANASTSPVLDDVGAQDIRIGNQSIPIGTDNPNATVSAPEFQLVNYSFALNRSLQPAAGDRIHLRYPVKNPTEAGNYTVSVVLASGDNASVSYETNLTVTPNETAGATTTTSMATGTTTSSGTATSVGTTVSTSGTTAETTQSTSGDTTAQGTTNGSSGGGSTTTGGSGPGFTTLAGLVGLLAVALFALRRN